MSRPDIQNPLTKLHIINRSRVLADDITAPLEGGDIKIPHRARDHGTQFLRILYANVYRYRIKPLSLRETRAINSN